MQRRRCARDDHCSTHWGKFKVGVSLYGACVSYIRTFVHTWVIYSRVFIDLEHSFLQDSELRQHTPAAAGVLEASKQPASHQPTNGPSDAKVRVEKAASEFWSPLFCASSLVVCSLFRHFLSPSLSDTTQVTCSIIHLCTQSM